MTWMPTTLANPKTWPPQPRGGGVSTCLYLLGDPYAPNMFVTSISTELFTQMHWIKEHCSLHKLQGNYRLLTQGGLKEASLSPTTEFSPLVREAIRTPL